MTSREINIEVESKLDPRCPRSCLQRNVEPVASGFVALAVEAGIVDDADPAAYDVLCQVRCEGPVRRGLLRRPDCGIVASLQLFKDEVVVQEGAFHNWA